MFYARDDFGGRGGTVDAQQVQARFVEKLSPARAKDLAHDYLEREVSAPASPPELEATPERWDRLEAEHEKARESDEEGPRKQIEKELQSLTPEIKTNPELNRWVLKLRIELDDRSPRLDRVLEERDLHRALRLSIDHGRDYGLSL